MESEDKEMLKLIAKDLFEIRNKIVNSVSKPEPIDNWDVSLLNYNPKLNNDDWD